MNPYIATSRHFKLHRITSNKIQAYTCRQVNTLPEKPLPLFNVVVICDINQLDEATAALKCFDEVERAHWYNKSVQTGV